jgi:lipoprotein-releasing system permease protein
MLEALFVAVPVTVTVLALLAFGVALASRPFAVRVGWRYLRSPKRGNVSVITFIAVAGVALGVAALLAVMSITSGFQDEFRTKVLGVNAHVLVLKYGLDFSEYGRVVEQALEMPEVAGAAPFLIQQMMVARGDRISTILVKGVDPEAMPTVLDLPQQIVDGDLEGLRVLGSLPPSRPEDLSRPITASEETDLDRFLLGLQEELGERPGPPAADDDGFIEVDALPETEVVDPEEAGTALAPPTIGDGFVVDDEGLDLPPDELEDQLIAEEQLLFEDEREGSAVVPTGRLPGIVIGAELASNLELSVGDRVSVISPLAGLDSSFFGREPEGPRSFDFRVVGIFQAGFQEYDSRLVYVDLYEAQRFFDHGDSVTGVELRLHDLERSEEIARRLERVLGGGPYHTMDWRELNRNLFTALEIQKVILSLVIATIILVAAFNVIATLIMVVLEKKREIAILKAMGARSGSILLVFMVQGVLIGLVGTLLGLLLGGGVCLYLERFEFPLDPAVYLIDHLPVRTSLLEYVLTVCLALFICMVATVIPSWWAARLLPAEGVRYE